jgi:hypothetical protein
VLADPVQYGCIVEPHIVPLDLLLGFAQVVVIEDIEIQFELASSWL